ncbi:MAG: UDP-3-O-(3-hydroxymyristoyl)glucosamine N-acyltransferase [Gammaproteobacteria bacterium]|nr:UDP-3-O-(3-hydroxymyristoyl)glucosamine N-acyltransferase [Gammaproteobacteria bacterium]
MSIVKTYTLGALAELLDASLIGDESCVIDGLATLKQGSPGKLSFLSNPAYANQLPVCRASAVILEEKFVDSCLVNKLVSTSPYVSYAKASQLFDNSPPVLPGIHPTASVNESAEIPDDCSIGASAVIAAGVTVGRGVIIGAGCVVNENCTLGEGCRLYSNVTLYHGVSLGDRVSIHSGSVIGADGFGFAFDGSKAVKINQLGSVIIGDDVEIGSGTTIDRGAIEDTVIEQGVKIDNQVQIGHNCRVGAHTIICGCSAIAGSAVIGSYCVLGGGSGVVGHIQVADRVRVSAMSLVTQSIDESGDYSSGTGIMKAPLWRRNAVRFSKLDEIVRRVKRLENKEG